VLESDLASKKGNRQSELSEISPTLSIQRGASLVYATPEYSLAHCYFDNSQQDNKWSTPFSASEAHLCATKFTLCLGKNSRMTICFMHEMETCEMIDPGRFFEANQVPLIMTTLPLSPQRALKSPALNTNRKLSVTECSRTSSREVHETECLSPNQ
jgi:hypothetical protein